MGERGPGLRFRRVREAGPLLTEHVTPSRAAELLRRHGLHARKGFGQHFLVDPNTVRRIVRLAGVRADEAILEIGPGLGSLTVALAEAARRVVALEIDERMSDVLEEVVGGTPNVEVVVGDALRADLSALCGGRARLVSNLPYNVATPIVARVLDDVDEIAGGLVMVQRELGERWTAPPGSKTYGAISVRVAFHARARVVGEVPRTVFLPPPGVDSVLVAFERRAQPPVDVDDPRAFLRLVEAAFAHRRKTLRNALGAAGHDKTDVEAALAGAGLEPASRAEELSIEDFARLYRALGDDRR